MSKVLCTDPLPQVFVDQCQALLPTGVDFAAVSTFAEGDFARLAADTEALFVLHRLVDARLLSLAPRLKLIQRNGLGYENIDIEAARAAGIPVCYTPGANAANVAEHAVLLMLAIVKRFVPAEQAARAGGWPMMEFAQAGIGDLAGTTIGLVGLGHTGQAVAERLAPFGADLVYYTRHRVDSALEKQLGVRYLNLDDLLASAQIVSLHLPLTAATHNLFNDERFARMQKGAYLVNVSRGGVIDESALRRAVESDHLAGAALDTVVEERDGGNPFTDLPEIIVTPHTAGPSRRGIEALLQHSFSNIRRVLAGEPPRDLVPEMTVEVKGDDASR